MPYKPGDLTKGVVGAAAGASKDVATAARRRVFEEAGKHVNWWELPLPLQLAALAAFREDLREFNLYDVEEPVGSAGADPIATVESADAIPLRLRLAAKSRALSRPAMVTHPRLSSPSRLRTGPTTARRPTQTTRGWG